MSNQLSYQWHALNHLAAAQKQQYRARQETDYTANSQQQNPVHGTSQRTAAQQQHKKPRHDDGGMSTSNNKPCPGHSQRTSTGLGACLMQNSRPVAYASRSLSEYETRYAQIEKELLVIVFAVTKFHYFIYGTQVGVESDHKPLEAILRKPLHKATHRIQLMLLKLMWYKLEIKYVPGSRMYIADTLSWAYVPGEEDDSMDMALGHG